MSAIDVNEIMLEPDFSPVESSESNQYNFDWGNETTDITFESPGINWGFSGWHNGVEYTGTGTLVDFCTWLEDVHNDDSFGLCPNSPYVIGVPNPSPVPLPAAVWLFATAIGALVLAKRKRASK
jgi:hypothetical protein